MMTKNQEVVLKCITNHSSNMKTLKPQISYGCTKKFDSLLRTISIDHSPRSIAKLLHKLYLSNECRTYELFLN